MAMIRSLTNPTWRWQPDHLPQRHIREDEDLWRVLLVSLLIAAILILILLLFGQGLVLEWGVDPGPDAVPPPPPPLSR